MATSDDYKEMQDSVFRQYQTLRVDTREDGLDIVTLNRPPMNPLSKKMFLELAHYFDRLRTDFSVRVVILRAEGKAFCAGLDLSSLTGNEEKNSKEEATQTLIAGQRRVSDLPKYMRACPQPIICCVQGAAAGGGFGLALASDVRFCTHKARFNVAMIRLGLSGLDVGISYHLPRLVGTSVASEFILTGRFMDADRAYRSGLVSQVFDNQPSMDTAAVDLANDMLSNNAMALRYTKEGLNLNIDAPSLQAALDTEDRTQVLLSMANSSDIAERMRKYVPPKKSKM